MVSHKRERQRGISHSWRKKAYKDGRQRLEGDATASQGTLAATGSWKRHRVDFPLEPLEGVREDTLVQD